MQQAWRTTKALFDCSYKYHSADEHWMNAAVGVNSVLVVPDRSPSCQRRAQQHSDGALRLTQRRWDVFIVKDWGWKKKIKQEWKPHRRVKVEILWRKWIITFLHFCTKANTCCLFESLIGHVVVLGLDIFVFFPPRTLKRSVCVSVCYLYSLPAHVSCVLQCVEASHTVPLTDDD